MTNYEFSAVENETIKSTGSRTTMYGYVSIVLGVLGMLVGGGVAFAVGGVALPIGLGLAVALLPNLVSGFWYIEAGRALQGVVETQGDDVALMMAAVSRIRDAFRLEGIASIVGFVLGGVAGAALAANSVH